MLPNLFMCIYNFIHLNNIVYTDLSMYSLNALKLFISHCEQTLLAEQMVGGVSGRRGWNQGISYSLSEQTATISLRIYIMKQFV